MTTLHIMVSFLHGELIGQSTHIDGADPEELDLDRRTAVVHCTHAFVQLRRNAGKAHHWCLPCAHAF